MYIKFCNINDYSDFSKISFLTEERQNQVNRFKQLDDKKRCYCAGLLLYDLFGEKAFNIKVDSFGKPYLPNENIYFNISHSGNYVVLVSDDNEIGIDIEEIREIPEGVANRCFTTDEINYLNANYSEVNFYKIWTAKESILKAIGKGFSVNPNSFSVLPLKKDLHQINGENYFLNWEKFENYIICCVSKNELSDDYFDEIKLLNGFNC